MSEETERKMRWRWEERIREAKEYGGFTEEDRYLASSWVTCACGEQDERIARNPNRSPKDGILSALGSDFMGAVETDSWGKAKNILAQIEKRSAEILAKVKP